MSQNSGKCPSEFSIARGDSFKLLLLVRQPKTQRYSVQCMRKPENAYIFEKMKTVISLAFKKKKKEFMRVINLLINPGY